MASLVIVSLMASLWFVQAPIAERPVLSIAPDAKVTLRIVKAGDRSFIWVEGTGMTLETARLRARVDGKVIDLDAVDEGIRFEAGDAVGIFTERTFVGGGKRKN